jgi:adenylate cyclase
MALWSTLRVSRVAPLVISSAVLLLGLALQIADPPLVADLRNKVYDILQRTAPRPYVDAPVRIVDIDDETLARHGQWPWPRTLVAELIRRLAEAGSASIALDILFSEPDRTSPAQVIPLWPSTPATEALRSQAGELPDHDDILARTIGAANVVTGFVLTGGAPGRMPAERAGFAVAGEDARLFVRSFPGAVVDLPNIEAAAPGSGSINVVPDGDGIVRRAPLIIAGGETLYPSLAAEALRLALGASSYLVKTIGASGLDELSTQIGVVELKLGDFIARTDEQGQVVLYDSGPVAERVIPAWRVFDASFDPTTVAGRIMLIGTSAAGLKDLRATPLNPLAAGVEVHAQIIEQIVNGTYLSRPPWLALAELLFLLAFGVGMIVVVALWGALYGLVAVVIAVVGAWQAFAAAQVLTAPLLPVVALAVLYLVAGVTSYLRVEGERRRVRDAFSHYMSPVMVARLANNPAQLKLGGEVREMSIMFSDIRGFTDLSERLQDAPEELTFVVNRFFTAMTDRILECGGTIDKYMGDAVMAF